MAEKLDKLTPEQEKIMYETRDYWIDRFFQTKRIDEKAFEEGIEWLYTKMLNIKAPTIVYCESWNDALEKIVAQYATLGETKTKKDVFNDYSSYVSSYSNFGWVAYYDFFDKIGIIDNKDFEQYRELIRSCVFQCYTYDTHVFAIHPPKKIHTNDEGQLHSIEEAAIQFEDGTGYYYVNGAEIPKKYWDKIQGGTFTMDDFMKETHEEIKSSCLALMQLIGGDSAIATFFSKDLKEVDTYTDEKLPEYLVGTLAEAGIAGSNGKGMNIGVYTLFKGSISDTPAAYVRCYCPSTDRMFFLGVEDTQTNAKDAIASLFRIPRKLKNHIKYINRQGERFVTVLDDKGKKLQKSLTKEDFQDVVSISGDEYFSKMRYEY